MVALGDFRVGENRSFSTELQLAPQGVAVEFNAAEVSKSIGGDRDTLVQLYFREGTAFRRFWTTDLTAEYIRLNADYHT